MNFYLKCVRALDQVANYRGNVKTAIFDLLNKNSVNQNEIRKVYSLCIQTLQNSSQLDEALYFLTQNKKVQIKNRNFAKVLLNELLFGKFKTVKGGGQVKRLLVEHLPSIRKELGISETADSSQNSAAKQLIRSNVFIRIVKNRITLEHFKQFCADDQIQADDTVPDSFWMNYASYKKLRESENFASSSMYVLQSKSSCLPPVCLKQYFSKFDLQDSFDIIDGCSAPGNKTFQIAEYFPECKVLAIEKNPKRFEILRERNALYNVGNVQCFNSDFLEINSEDKQYNNVKIIALDPSCSGSGMQNQLQNTKLDATADDFAEKVDNAWEELAQDAQERVKKLSALQLKLLTHALNFSTLRYLIYSTCSIYPQENELVVKKLLSQNKERLSLVNVLPEWSIRGFASQFPGAKKCVREIPGRNSNDGFFVAMFKVKSM